MKNFTIPCGKETVPALRVHTLIVGSGAAGLNAAVQLKRQGIDDILILTEGLEMGTSINTGSDKQTYYKLSLSGKEGDSPALMAESYFHSGSMHGDLALVESALSTRAFLNLVQLGVRFPQDRWGQFVGYKTDHDPATRATSVGPYTSRDMCRALIAEVHKNGIPVEEKRYVHKLLTTGEGADQRCCGVLAVDDRGQQMAYAADNIVFAVGGPGGLYQTSVYPKVHTGAIGVALEAGAKAQNLQESQFGMASIKFRWNVSGSYMQVIPAFISTEADGESDPREFLQDSFSDAGELCSLIFLKGYQWPFDVRNVKDGSSVIDLLVHIETVVKGRRVFLDFRTNPHGFDFNALSREAKEYLEKSGVVQNTPIARLEKINPGAVQLYGHHGIDLHQERLEIAVCAQHNNGGLAANHWYESVNIKGLFPIGEVNGSHGVARPGGSALNAGQVGGIRAAEYIAHCGRASKFDQDVFVSVALSALQACVEFVWRCERSMHSLSEAKAAMQERMSRVGAHIRLERAVEQAVDAARQDLERLVNEGCLALGGQELVQALCYRQLCLAHLVYLETILYYIKSRAGSRGSAMVVESGVDGLPLEAWQTVPEDTGFRELVLETLFEDGAVFNEWVERRLLPDDALWFESVWSDFREGKIYS